MELEKQRILVVGGDGFIGRHLVNALRKKDAGHLSILERITENEAHKGLTYYHTELKDEQAVAETLGNTQFDTVFNLAGRIDQSSKAGIYKSQLSDNLITTANLAEVLNGKTKRFIQIGSNAEYGNIPCPQFGNGPASPCSAYGVAKLAASELILSRYRSEGFPGLVARPFLVYGPGQADASFLGAALRSARDGSSFSVSPSEQTRDFTPIEKIADELIQLSILPPEQVLGKAFNLCTGVGLTLKRVLALISEACPRFQPQIGAIPYRDTELMESFGHAFIPWGKERVEEALRDFINKSLVQ